MEKGVKENRKGCKKGVKWKDGTQQLKIKRTIKSRNKIGKRGHIKGTGTRRKMATMYRNL